MLILWAVGSFSIILLENGDLTDVGNAIWWTIVTMTTVGYGDISPNTELGQALASLAMIVGYATIAIATGFISAEYTSMKQKINNIVCNRRSFRYLIRSNILRFLVSSDFCNIVN